MLPLTQFECNQKPLLIHTVHEDDEVLLNTPDAEWFRVLYPIFRTKRIPQCLIYPFPNTIYFKNFQIFCQIEYYTFSIAFMRSCSEKSENQLMS